VLVHTPNDLVTGDQLGAVRRQIPFDHVKVRPAHAANLDANPKLTRRRLRNWTFDDA
jgi:hypothetical protein